MSQTPKGKVFQANVSSLPLYNVEEVVSLLRGVYLASGKPSSFDNHGCNNTASPKQQECQFSSIDLENLSISDKMICATCAEPFTNREEQIQHYKSDWHRFNLKKKLKGEDTLTEDKFLEVTGEISSISGSETDSDTGQPRRAADLDSSSEEEESHHIEGIGRRHPRVFLKNSNGELFSVYRCLLYGKRSQPETVEELMNLVNQLPQKLKWLIIMVAGGHFAAAVFNGSEVVAHKTFHRYVVRAKRGTAQSTHDSQGGHAKSVGAFLRRHHEAALYEDIRKLLIEWDGHLKSCDHIFLRAPGNNQKALFSGKDCPLKRQDTRLHMVPFPTRRPTFSEVKRVHDILTAIHCYGTDAKLTDHISPSKSKKTKTKIQETIIEGENVLKAADNVSSMTVEDSSDSETEFKLSPETIDLGELREFEVNTKVKRHKKKNKKEKVQSTGHISDCESQDDTVKSDPEEDMCLAADVFCGLKNDFYTAVKVGNVESLKSLVDRLQKDGANVPAVMNKSISVDGNRLLHIASQHTNSMLIRFLLDSGADPAVRNMKNEYPYVLSKDKECRNEYRRFVADHPEKYDYVAAQIPGPLTSEMEEERRIKEAEKRKLQKKAKKNRLKTQREEEKVKKKEIEEKERFLNLSDREKRALAAEKRFTAQMKDQGVCEIPSMSRCFLCGADITGKILFEYSDNKFCTTKCLKDHRMMNKT